MKCLLCGKNYIKCFQMIFVSNRWGGYNCYPYIMMRKMNFRRVN